MSPRLMLVLALAATACRGEGRSAPSESSSAPATVPTVTTTSAPEVTPSTTAEPAATADDCSPGQPISPAALAASWPSKLGSRVRFKGHIDVSVDVMTAVVLAGGHRFVVVASPDQLWQGDRERTYTVMGSKTVALGGRTTLPQLLLEAECSP